MAAAAAAAHTSAMAAASHQQQQQPQQDGEVLDLETLWSQQAQQQREQSRAQAQQQLRLEQLAASGLTLSAEGAVVPLLLDPLPQPQQPQDNNAGAFADADAVYADYEAAAAAAARLEALYDTTDDDYAFTPLSLDGVIPRLDYAPGSSSSSSVFDSLDVDLALLVLLVAATAGMCMAFLQSLLQLREALYAQQQQQQYPAAPFLRLNRCKPVMITAATGDRNVVSNIVTDTDELTQPLLVSPQDSEFAQEQQQQQGVAAAAAGSGVQRFYNPLCYQQLPSGEGQM